MNENQIYLLRCQLAMGHAVFWHGGDGWHEIVRLASEEVGMELPAYFGGVGGKYIDLYNVDVDDLMVVVKMNVDWQKELLLCES